MQRLLIAASAVAVAGFMAPPARPTSVRMDASVDSILEDIKGLTLVEASELVSKIEETFGVDASSALETAPGVKDAAAVRRYVQEARAAAAALDATTPAAV